MDKNARILISGAGIAGLTSAIWLGKAGFRPLIVERAPHIGADGFLLSLSHQAYDLLQEMGIVEDLIAVGNRIERSSYLDRGGQPILELDYERLFETGNVVHVTQDDLETVLYERARDTSEFQFSNCVTNIEQTSEEVLVAFQDGSANSFDLVIGADGSHSAVRECGFASYEFERHYLGLHSAAFRSENLLGLSHKYEAYLEPDRHTVLYTTRTNDLACIFIWRNDEQSVPPPGQERLEHLRDAYRGADPRIMELVDSRGEQDRIYMEALNQIEMPRWHEGRVVLVGDGAHSLTQLSGQGASMAIRGASALARAVASGPINDAIENYEATIRPIVSKLQSAVRNNAKWYVPGGMATYLIRDACMRYLPNELWVRYFKFKHSRG